MFSRDVRILDVEYLTTLYREDRLLLRPEFQRNAIWPRAAKSYLIDTLLRERPVPLLFLQKLASAQTGQPGYAVVDGQQRLLAIFEYIDNGYRLSGPDISEEYRGSRFSDLQGHQQDAVLSYGLAVEELAGYSASDIKDIFVRLNKYGVRLSPQELRHAEAEGAFKKVVEAVGGWSFWTDSGTLTRARAARMRADELAAELLILLDEGAPQDKKGVVSDYYRSRAVEFPEGAELVQRLRSYLDWISASLGDRRSSRFLKAAELYTLIGALDRASAQGEALDSIVSTTAGSRLRAFEAELRTEPRSHRASSYLLAASRQTDNLAPRMTRMQILEDLLLAGKQ